MEKPSRPVRNRRHSRRAWPPGENRPVKRLFTPEIKRMLKDWLIRRRDSPYPSRDEKKSLAVETGLTYTQICNWFANWRRKLKNSGREPSKKTWGNLIKNYNTNAKGNVEQFSISSGDSIWEDDDERSQLSISPHPIGNYDVIETRINHTYQQHYNNNNNNNNINTNNNNKELFNRQYYDFVQRNANETGFSESFKNHEFICNDDIKNYLKQTTDTMNDHCYDHCYTPMKQPSPINSSQAQCFQISSTTTDDATTMNMMQKLENNSQRQTDDVVKTIAGISTNNAKYKNNIMEKYLRGLDETIPHEKNAPQLSKWLESAANFKPNKNNYIDWNSQKNKSDKKRCKYNDSNMMIHQKEELDAAEALINFRNRILNISSQ